MSSIAATTLQTATARDVLVENLAALWASDPDLARAVDNVPDIELLPLTPTKSGHHTASVTTGARSISLASRYDPVDEAARLAERVPPERYELFVLGMGLGYHVQQLSKRFDSATLWVFEPDVRVIRAAFECVDLSEAILEKKIRIVARLDKGQLFADWTPHLAAMSVGHHVVDHPPSVQLHADALAQARALIEEFLAFGKTTINTLLVNSRRTCENLAQNIPWYVANPGIGRLKNAMAGKPAIIVAAGPSLRKNKHLLPGAVGKAVIISVQTAFQQLLDIGVEPNFVTSLDYHDICTQFFQHVPRHVRTELVAEPKATPKIFDLNPGPLSLLGNNFIEQLLREMKLDRPGLPSGATVAHLAYYLAEYLGCNPIIFVGQDLGFSDGLAYTPGTSYDDLWRPELSRYNTVEMMQWQRIVRDRAILRKVPDYRGGTTYTEERLYTYLQQFERDFAQSTRTIIDATEGGVAKRGTKVMTLADALEQHCREPMGAAVPAHDGLRWDRLTDAMAGLTARLLEAEQIESISRQTLPLLKDIRESLENQARVNQLIAKIDPLRSKMNEIGSTYDLITQLTQQSELDRYAADRRIAAAGIDGMEKQRRQIDRDIANVEHMITAAEAFESLMKRCIDITRSFQERAR
jgi:hypothetical protein